MISKIQEDVWRWSRTQEIINYQRWNNWKKEPNGKQRENCLQFPLGYSHWSPNMHGFWNDKSCSSKCRPICQKHLNTVSQNKGRFLCPNDWVDLGSSGCYHFGVDTSDKTWDEAEYYCKTLINGARLAEIYDETSHHKISAFYHLHHQGEFFWIGGRSDNKVSVSYHSLVLKSNEKEINFNYPRVAFGNG